MANIMISDFGLKKALHILINLTHLIFWIKSLFSPHGEIYGLVHVGRQPEREICGKRT